MIYAVSLMEGKHRPWSVFRFLHSREISESRWIFKLAEERNYEIQYVDMETGDLGLKIGGNS